MLLETWCKEEAAVTLQLHQQADRRGSLHVRHGRDPQAAHFREAFALPVGASCCPFQTVRDSIPRQVDKKSRIPKEEERTNVFFPTFLSKDYITIMYPA